MPQHVLPQVSTILFDVGNTLHHLDHAFIGDAVTRHSHQVEAQEVAVAECVAKATVDALVRERRAGGDASRRFSYFETILAALQVPPAAMAPILAALHAEDARASLWRVMRPGTPGVIAELRRRGFTLGVVSNADGRVPASIAASGLGDHFTVVVDSHLVGVEKPDAEIFHIALRACGAQPGETVYVGDIYEIDVRGARNAGITPVLLDPLDSYRQADCPRISDLAELIELLPAAARRS
jgi:HAD superfamily hydrolase (TIGR01509 family)